MRRVHGNVGYDTDRTDLLQDEEEVEKLKYKATALKSLCIDIGTEVRTQKRLIDEMDDDFDRTGGFLTATVGRVKNLIKSRHYCYMFTLILFSFGVFLFIYAIRKFR